MKTFRDFLEQNISDVLSSDPSAKSIKAEVRAFLQNELSSRDLDTAVNLFSYIYLKEGKGDIRNDWVTFKDYLKENLSVNRTLFVNHITRKQLEDLNERYHINLKINVKNFRKGPKGLEAVNVSKNLQELSSVVALPNNFKPSLWEGWKWVSLGCGYSGEEAAAGGHCGNVGNKAGDNILSLRNPNYQVVLTFIVNVKTGALGEAKGVNNEKPAKELHPAIVALLSSSYVRKIEGGGYNPENNFSLEDLKYNEALYNYFSKHLEGEKEHSIPDNYLPLSWLDNITDEKIEREYGTAERKVELLRNVLNVFSNYSVFAEDDTAKEFKINFDLNKLAKDALAMNSSNPKQLIDILNKLTDIYAGNRVWGEKPLELFRPEIDGSKLQKGEDDEFLDYIRKIESVNLEMDTIKSVIKQLVNKKLSIRDKTSLFNTIQRILQEHTIKDEFLSSSLKKLQNEIFQEMLQANKVPSFAEGMLIDTLWNTAFAEGDDNEYLRIIRFNPRKQAVEFATYRGIFMSLNKEESSVFDLKFNELFSKIKHQFIKRGIASGGTSEKHVRDCAKESFERHLFSIGTRVFEKRYGFFKEKEKKKDPTAPMSIFKRVPIKEVLNDLLAGLTRGKIREFDEIIIKTKESVFNKAIRDLDSFVIKNIDSLCDCAKEKAEQHKKLMASLGNRVLPTKKHTKKIKWEDPADLRRQRAATRQHAMWAMLKKSRQEAEAERAARIKQDAERMAQRRVLQTTESFKEWLRFD